MVIISGVPIFRIFTVHVHCDHTLEPFWRDSSNDVSQPMFKAKKGKLSLNYPRYPFLTGTLVGSNKLHIYKSGTQDSTK